MRINVYDYCGESGADARKFLKDYYRAERRLRPGLRYRNIAKWLGHSSPAYFPNMVEGKILFNEKNIKALAEKVLKLDPEETEYFKALCFFTQSPEGSYERRCHHEHMMQLQKLPSKGVQQDSFEYYKKWRHGAIRALLDVLDCDGTPGSLDKVARQLYPPVKIAQAKRSFSLLKRLGLIARNEQGYWKPQDQILWTGGMARSNPEANRAIQEYQGEYLRIAGKAITGNPPGPKKIIMETVSLSRSALQQIESKLQKCRNEILCIIRQDADKSEAVYQIGMSLLPHSRPLASEPR